MKLRFHAIAVAIATSLSAVSVVALAEPPQDEHSAREDLKFPMPAAEFRQHVARHVEKSRQHMEKRIAEKQLEKDKADEARARFASAVALVNAKVDEVCADGTVTREEAEAVHQLAKSLHHHAKH
jgi:hypothetical protein